MGSSGQSSTEARGQGRLVGERVSACWHSLEACLRRQGVRPRRRPPLCTDAARLAAVVHISTLVGRAPAEVPGILGLHCQQAVAGSQRLLGVGHVLREAWGAEGQGGRSSGSGRRGRAGGWETAACLATQLDATQRIVLSRLVGTAELGLPAAGRISCMGKHRAAAESKALHPFGKDAKLPRNGGSLTQAFRAVERVVREKRPCRSAAAVEGDLHRSTAAPRAQSMRRLQQGMQWVQSRLPVKGSLDAQGASDVAPRTSVPRGLSASWK